MYFQKFNVKVLFSSFLSAWYCSGAFLRPRIRDPQDKTHIKTHISLLLCTDSCYGFLIVKSSKHWSSVLLILYIRVVASGRLSTRTWVLRAAVAREALLPDRALSQFTTADSFLVHSHTTRSMHSVRRRVLCFLGGTCQLHVYNSFLLTSGIPLGHYTFARRIVELYAVFKMSLDKFINFNLTNLVMILPFLCPFSCLHSFHLMKINTV